LTYIGFTVAAEANPVTTESHSMHRRELLTGRASIQQLCTGNRAVT